MWRRPLTSWPEGLVAGARRNKVLGANGAIAGPSSVSADRSKMLRYLVPMLPLPISAPAPTLGGWRPYAVQEGVELRQIFPL